MTDVLSPIELVQSQIESVQSQLDLTAVDSVQTIADVTAPNPKKRSAESDSLLKEHAPEPKRLPTKRKVEDLTIAHPSGGVIWTPKEFPKPPNGAVVAVTWRSDNAVTVRYLLLASKINDDMWAQLVAADNFRLVYGDVFEEPHFYETSIVDSEQAVEVLWNAFSGHGEGIHMERPSLYLQITEIGVKVPEHARIDWKKIAAHIDIDEGDTFGDQLYHQECSDESDDNDEADSSFNKSQRH